ncbi:hypothetical protein GCM10027066_33940 [Dyella jejuensis]
MVAVATVAFAMSSPRAEAQVAVGVNIGPAPVCPYGYYDYAPYSCAPYGYYGPEWFNGGVFIGAGPWYRGPAHFRGHVDNRFDVRGGYHGPMPQHGERPAPHPGGGFHGNEMRDGRGHVVH